MTNNGMTAREFEKEYKLLFTPLCMFALRMTENVDIARDIVQDSFSTVWQKLEAGLQIENLKPYMYRTVNNAVLMHKRDSAIEITGIELPDVPEEKVDLSERDAKIWIAVGKLPQKCREVFLLAKRDGLSHAEIADELGISRKTVENHITKALSILRESLADINSGDNFVLFFL